MTATAVTIAQPTIATNLLAAHPRNPRRAVGNVDDIVASAKQVGILEPLIVAPPPTDLDVKLGKAEYVVLCGNRRYTAAKQARLREVPVVVREDATTLAAQIEIMLIENLHRTDLTPVEEGDAYQQVMQLEGLTQKALADKLGQNRTRISERVRLAKSTVAVRDAAHSGQITITEALAIAEFRDDPDVEKRLLDAIGTDDLQFALNRARQDRQREKDHNERRDRLTAAGWLVFQWGGNDEPEYFRTLTYPDWREEELALANHGDCPGRAVRFSTYGEWQFGCTQVHDQEREEPPAERDPSPGERAAAEARVAAQERLARDIDAAAATRDQFVQNLLARSAGLTDDVVRARLVEMILEAALGEAGEPGYLVDLVKALGTPEQTLNDLDDDPDALLLEARRRLTDRTSIPSLVACLDVAMHLEHAIQLAYVWSTGEYSREWLDALNAYGYTWSEFERGRYRFPIIDSDGDPTTETWTVDGILSGQPGDDDPGDEQDEDGAA